MKKIIFFTTLIILFLTGCAQKNPYTPTRSLQTYENTKLYNNINISQALLSHYQQWKGVKYKYGGNSKDGVDCSYFVQDTLLSNLNKKIPRTTYYQSKVGENISKNQLQTGDLVFFITGKKGGRHVGIYLDYGDFMHVSTSRGVMISNLNNPYWKQHYWKSKRVLLKK